jgi:hypothetical protein
MNLAETGGLRKLQDYDAPTSFLLPSSSETRRRELWTRRPFMPSSRYRRIHLTRLWFWVDLVLAIERRLDFVLTEIGQNVFERELALGQAHDVWSIHTPERSERRLLNIVVFRARIVVRLPQLLELGR